MDRKNADDVFSPIRNFDEENSKRRTDSFSKFLKGPDVFKKISDDSADVENEDQSTLLKNISNKKSSKAHQKKTKKEKPSEETSRSSAATNESVYFTSQEECHVLKKEKSKESISSSEGRKDIAINFITKRNSKIESNQQSVVDCKKARPDAHSKERNSQSQAAVAVETSELKEIKKTDDSSSIRQNNPSFQIQSGVFEKLINDAVETRFDDMEQLLYSQFFEVQKSIHVKMEKMEEKHASEQATMFRVVEALLEENRCLRNFILAPR